MKGDNWDNRIVICPTEESVEVKFFMSVTWCVCVYIELYHNDQVPTFAIWEDKSEEPSGD